MHNGSGRSLHGNVAIMAKRRRKSRGLSGTSKKDYVAIGNILCRNGASAKLVEDIAQYFREDNSAFNPITFVAHVAKCKR
jgi:hypothetical protein